MKILLATDGSAHSNAAAEEVARWALAPNTEVRVVSAYEIPSLILSAPLSAGNMAPTYEDAGVITRKPAEDAVERAAKTIVESHPKLSISTEVLIGSPKTAILDEADAFGADLIVVGSQGQNAIDRFLMGSVSQSVALHAKCSVQIVRKHNVGYNK